MKRGTVFISCVITGVLVFTSVVHAAETIRGTPGVDYPNFHSIPKTSFSCSEQKYIPGFYADLETNCQAFHFCFKDGQESFLCPTGTTYNQETLACDSWYSSNCSLAPLSYSINAGPAMENAGRNIPTLLKLRNRSQGKSMPSSTPNIFEKLSSLYEEGADPAAAGTSGSSEDLSEVSNLNVSRDESSEESGDGFESEEHKEESFSENTASEEEESFQADAGVEGEMEEIVYDGLSEGQEEELDEGLVYDPISDGYYMNYDPYEAEWQQEYGPTSDQFRSFYDYRSQGSQYGMLGDSSEENELLAEPDDLDLNEIGNDGTETDFSRRRLNVEHSSKRYRRRPMYVVVEDEPEMDASSEVESSAEYESSDVDEASTEIPEGLTDETRHRILNEQEFPENGDGPEWDRETATSLPSEHEQIYRDESAEGVLADFPSDQFADATGDDESGIPAFDFDNESPAYDQEAYEDSDPNTWYQTDDGPEISDVGEAEDTFIVLRDETDEVPDSGPGYVNVEDVVDGDSEIEYVYETDENEQADFGDAYQDEYEYYRSHREFPDGYEAVESSSYQRPDYDYLRQYGGQYVPRRYDEDDDGYEEDLDSRYTPEEESYYVRQQYRPSYMDPDYESESGYYRDDFSQNPYTEVDENSDYYTSDEASEYYSQPDVPWVEEAEDVEMENQLGVTDVPLPVDITEADFTNLDEDLSNSVEQGDVELNDFATEGESNEEETYYVFDFDGDDQKNEGESELNVDSSESDVHRSDMEDYSDQLDMKEAFSDNLHSSDESTLNENTSFYKDGSDTSSESSRTDSIGIRPFLSSQNGDGKYPDFPSNSGASFNMKPLTDNWSPFVTESNLLDQPVTLSSALERLAALNAVKPPLAPGVDNLDFSGDSLYLNNMGFPGSMDFGPYGYGAGFGQQFGLVNPLQPNEVEGFSHRTGENEQPKVPKLTSIQERLRSMKHGKFGVFKKYMKSMKKP